MDSVSKWLLTDAEKDEFIATLTPNLPALRTQAEISQEELANLLGISRESAYELVREDNFPKLKIVQGRTIIPRDRLLEWLDEQTRYDELPR